MSESQQLPYKKLGKHLRYVREQSKQTMQEVCGAVEIDEEMLARIETGVERPPEDILLLLFSYFDLQDQEAVQLWELAGYDGDLPDKMMLPEEAAQAAKSMVMLLAIDMRTLYSDALDIDATKTGLTLSFKQNSGMSAPNPTSTAGKIAMPIARVGISYDQAEQIVLQLQQAIMHHKYNGGHRQLPPSTGNASEKL